MGTQVPHPHEGTLLSVAYLLAWPHLQVFTQAVPSAWEASSGTDEQNPTDLSRVCASAVLFPDLPFKAKLPFPPGLPLPPRALP